MKELTKIKKNTELLIRCYEIVGLAPKSIKAYLSDFKEYEQFCKYQGLNSFKLEALKKYKQQLLDTLSNKTLNRKIVAIRRGLYELAKVNMTVAQASILKQAVLENVKTLKLAQSEKSISSGKILTESEINELMEKATEKQSLFIEFLAVTGCRVSELVGAKLKDIKVKKQIAEIKVVGKGEKLRTVRFTVDLLQRIKNHFAGKKYLFETSNNKKYFIEYVTSQITRAGKKILNKHITAHTMRHSFATNKIRQTNKIKAVSEYLGHSSTAITLDLYTHEELTDNELFGKEKGT
jgi:integrase/recombinase XerD